MENHTDHEQKEIDNLMLELKDRDDELNEMLASHQKQKFVLVKKCGKLESENSTLKATLHQRDDQLRHLVVRLKRVESRHKSKMSDVEMYVRKSNKEIKGMQTMNESLELSTKQMAERIHDLEVKMEKREEEIQTQVHIKDLELSNARRTITTLEMNCSKLAAEVTNLRKEKEVFSLQTDEYKEKLVVCRKELEDIVASTTAEIKSLKDKVGKMKDEATKRERNTVMYRKLDNDLQRKCDFIEIQKSKQKRMETELSSLRQIFDAQQKDLISLQKNFKKSDEKVLKQEERINNIKEADDLIDDGLSEATDEILKEADKICLETSNDGSKPDKDDGLIKKRLLAEPANAQRLRELILKSQELMDSASSNISTSSKSSNDDGFVSEEVDQLYKKYLNKCH